MAQTKHEIRSFLAEAGARPLHRFGQNFMIDQNLVRVVAAAGEIGARDTVLEVGPGTGTLTEELLPHARRVAAAEIDRNLAALLRLRFEGNPNFQLIEGDALAGKHALDARIQAVIEVGRIDGPVKLVSNLPYNIASPLIIELLIAGVDLLAFTVQKEVAQRLIAAAGSESYGPLSVVAQMLGQVQLMRLLPPQAFWPEPKIESAMVRIRREDRLGGDAPEFGRFVHRLFSARRKTLHKALVLGGYDADEVLVRFPLDRKIRPEQLPPADFLRLFRAAIAQT